MRARGLNYSSTINSSHAGAATLLPDHANDDDVDDDNDNDDTDDNDYDDDNEESSRVMIF